MPLTEQFQAGVRVYLEPHSTALTQVLSRLIEYPFVPEIQHLDFEVFGDGFTQEFPVRAFFMDKNNCEYFVYEAGEAKYPCDINPNLLKLRQVYPVEFEEEFETQDEKFDSFTLASETLIKWFAQCWNAAGGRNFSRRAFIGMHDHPQRFDLVHGVWTDEW